MQQLRKRLAPPPGGALPAFASASASQPGPGGVLVVEDSQLPPATATTDCYSGFGAVAGGTGGSNGGGGPPEGGYLSGPEFMAADEVFKVRLTLCFAFNSTLALYMDDCSDCSAYSTLAEIKDGYCGAKHGLGVALAHGAKAQV